MIFIYDYFEEQVDILDIDYAFIREIGKFNTLEFETDREFDKGYKVVVIEDNEPYEFIIVDSTYEREDSNTFHYFCQDSIIENEGKAIGDKRPSGSYKAALTSVFEGTRWTLQYTGDFLESYTQTNSFFRISVLKAFSEIVETYNLEWYTKYKFHQEKITERILVIGKIGRIANSRLEFGKNIQKFTREIIAEPIYTALFGYGKGEELEDGTYGRRINFSAINNGLEYVANEDAREKYGIGSRGNKEHTFGFFIDEEETDMARLLDNTSKELERVSQVQAEYTVEAINLNIDASYGYEVDVLDEEIGFNGTVRVIKEARNYGDIEFTFGYVRQKFTDSITAEIKKSSEVIKNEVTSLIEQKLAEVTEDYFGEDGYNYNLKLDNEWGLPAGLYSFDKPIDQDPTKVIYVGAGKMLIANEKNPDGSWKFTTVATGDGFIADNMFAGKINADLIEMKGKTLQEAFQEVEDNVSGFSSSIEYLLGQDGVISPIEHAQIQNLIEQINHEHDSLSAQLEDDTIKNSFREKFDALNSFLSEIPTDGKTYSVVDTAVFKQAYAEYEEAKTAAENSIQQQTAERFSSMEAGQATLGKIIGSYEEQLKLESGLIAMYIDKGYGLEQAMTLASDELAFYLDGTKRIWIGLNGLNADSGIFSDLSFANHKTDKIGTEYTVISWTGGK